MVSAPDGARRAFLRGGGLDAASRNAVARQTLPLGSWPPGLQWCREWDEARRTRESGPEHGLKSGKELGEHPNHDVRWGKCAEVCAGCVGDCVSSCSAGIIRRHPAEHTLAGIPWLDFASGGCSFCGDCADGCPQMDDVDLRRGDLLADAGRAAMPRLPAVKIDTERCLAWNQVICMSCMGHCDYGAILRGRTGWIRIDADQCRGCGACISVCPVNALSC